ncbi:MAG TPA: adenosylcobinamide amidohydrolase, partial [Methylomirabilota bacterium]|nr:adenosylcobinamide amidohydrolase [Methylomirabilota bacterium]
MRVRVDAEAVVLTADEPLAVLSTAVAGGGAGRARAVVNLHVPHGFRCEGAEAALAGFAARRGLPPPWVGLLTAAPTETATTAAEGAGALRALAVVTVGLGHPEAAGASA